MNHSDHLEDYIPVFGETKYLKVNSNLSEQLEI